MARRSTVRDRHSLMHVGPSMMEDGPRRVVPRNTAHFVHASLGTDNTQSSVEREAISKVRMEMRTHKTREYSSCKMPVLHLDMVVFWGKVERCHQAIKDVEPYWTKPYISWKYSGRKSRKHQWQ